MKLGNIVECQRWKKEEGKVGKVVRIWDGYITVQFKDNTTAVFNPDAVKFLEKGTPPTTYCYEKKEKRNIFEIAKKYKENASIKKSQGD